MIDAFASFAFAVFFVICILILAAIAYFGLPIIAGIAVLIVALLYIVIFKIIQIPKHVYDYTKTAVGDHPKVPRRG